MTTDMKQVNFPHNERKLGVAAQAGHFLRHFLEMCITMCIGGFILNLLVFAAAPALTGDTNLRVQFPELSLLVIAFNFTLPMAAWMRFRGMEWRPILEMSGAAIGLGILLISVVWLGIAPNSTLQIGFGRFCGMACVAMVVPMLFRLDLYTGRACHMGHAHN